MGSVVRPLPLGRHHRHHVRPVLPQPVHADERRAAWRCGCATCRRAAPMSRWRRSPSGSTSAASGVMQGVHGGPLHLLGRAARRGRAGATRRVDRGRRRRSSWPRLVLGLVASWSRVCGGSPPGGWRSAGPSSARTSGCGRTARKLACSSGGGPRQALHDHLLRVSCRAFDITIGYADLGLLYLIGSTIGAAVPTPGGVGGVEAALIAVLTGAGVDNATAAAAVVVFRLVTLLAPGRARICLPPLLPDGRAGLSGGGGLQSSVAASRPASMASRKRAWSSTACSA